MVISTAQTQGVTDFICAGQLQTLVTGVHVVQVDAIGVGDNLVVLVHVVDNCFVRQGALRAFKTEFHAVNFHRVQIGNVLVVLQTIQFRGLRRTEAARDTELYVVAVIQLVTQTQFGCPVTEGILAIGRTVIAAAAETTGCAIFAGTAINHVVGVVIADALVTQAQGQIQTVFPGLLILHKRCDLCGINTVVIVFALRNGGNQEGRT